MNKTVIYIAALILLGGCAIKYNYLPEAKKAAVSPYGSNIKLYKGNSPIVNGEFLALQGNMVVVRTEFEPFIHFVDTTTVSSYYIQICNTKGFGILPTLAISHGLWMIFTFPINAVLAIVLKEKEKKDFRIHDLPFSVAVDYARYPQGLPDGYKLE